VDQQGGELQDSEHALQDLEGVEYGSVARIMQRAKTTDEETKGDVDK